MKRQVSVSTNYLVSRVGTLDSCFLQIVLRKNNMLNDEQNCICNTRITEKELPAK